MDSESGHVYKEKYRGDIHDSVKRMPTWHDDREGYRQKGISFRGE